MPPITIRQWGNHSQRDRNWATISAIAGLIPVSCVTIWHPLQTMPIWFIQFGQIHFGIWTNTFNNWDKYIWQFGQIHLAIWTNTFRNLDKYILQFGQIHFAIWTNTFCNLYKYICAIAGRLIPVSRSPDNAHLISGRIKWTLLMRWEFELHVIMIILHMLPPWYLITGTELRIWDPCHFDHLHRMARTCCQHRGRDRTLLCRGTHTHSPHLTHRGLGHIIRRRGSPT